MRNYGKATRRYRMGGIVPYEDVPQEDRAAEMGDVELDRRPGRSKSVEREIEENRKDVLDKKPETIDDQDVDPDDYLVPEDRDT